MNLPQDVLEIRLFGGFAVLLDGRSLPPLASRTARLLFAWLAMNAGRPQPRSVLVDRFWPDLPETRGRRRLSHALWQVQDSIGELLAGHSYVVTQGDDVLFDATTPFWLDVHEFEQRLDRVDSHGEVDAAGLRDLRQCVSLYQGELLAGSYESWVLEEQERLKQRYVTALGRLVDACKERGNFQEALAFAQRLTHQAPLREDAHREVMRLCVLLGQQSQALEQFERCQSVLVEELGTSPSAQTLELRDRIAQARDTSAPRRQPVEQLVSHRLVGRDTERVVLVDQLERTLAGDSAMVFVEGEPGIGKSQLLAHAADDARWRGFTVLWGECAGDERPYAAIRDAVESELGPVRVAQLRAHVEPVWLQEASRLLKPLANLGGAGSRAQPAGLSGADAAERMREAVVQVLTGLAAVEPLMLVIEDAQRADRETLELLRALGRHAGTRRMLVVLTFRDGDARHDEVVWSGLRAVDRDSRPVRIKLEPLTAFELAGLLREVLGASDVPASFVEGVFRESGGNPLYALELLRALRDQGMLAALDNEGLDALAVPVTDGLRQLIGGRLGYLGSTASDVAQLGAVLGTEFDIDTLRHGIECDERELTSALAELVRRNLLDMTQTACRFTHAATRRVVLDQLSPEALRQRHEAAGTALAATHPERVEDLAGHFTHAQRPAEALPYLRASAERACDLHAYATAATHFAAAVEQLGRVPAAVDDRFDILAQYEQVLGILGRRDEQADVLDLLADLCGDDIERSVEVALRQSTYLGLVDDFAKAAEVARNAVDLASPSRPLLQGRAMTSLGQVLSWSGDADTAVTVLAQAAELLADDAVTAGHARFALGVALRAQQRFDDAREQLSRAHRLGRDSDDQVGVVQALGALADVHAETGDTDRAVELYLDAVEQARQIGYRHREGVGLVNLGTVQLSQGKPVAALTAYDSALSVFEGLGNRRGVAMVQLNRAWTRHRWLGSDDDAERDAIAAHRYFQEIGNQGFAAICAETLAGIARRDGDLDRCAEHLGDGLAAAHAANDHRAEIQIMRGLIELALLRGDHDAAADTARDASRLVERFGIDEFAADVTSLHALGLLGTGDQAGAWRLAAAAAEYLVSAPEPHRVHQRIAEVAAAVGRDRRSTSHYQSAYRLLVDALAELDERTREAAVAAVPEHAAIIAAGSAVTPRTVMLRVARIQAPRGRALTEDEHVDVTVTLGPPAETPDRRRRDLVSVLQQVEQQHGQATVHDLANALAVSASTIRRDLRDLRSQGHPVETRGTAAG